LATDWERHDVRDIVDDALENADDELHAQFAQSESRELTDIRDALHRIDEGCYGLCENCKRPISTRRLLALPSACLCITCQRALEAPRRFRVTYPARWTRREEALV
jgi:DnaK suppressor protein